MSASSKKQSWFLLAGIALCIIFFFAFGREYINNIQIQKDIEELEAQKIEQEQAKTDAMHLIEELSSESFLEQEARLKQGLGRSGETVFIFSEEDDISDFDENEIVTASNLLKWFYYFFDGQDDL